MTDAVNEVTQSPEEQVAAAEADFTAGFESTQAKASTESTEVKTEDAKPAETKPETAPAAEAPSAPAQPVMIGGMTEADWNAAVAKGVGPVAEQLRAEIRKNFGQIGEVNKALKQIREQLAAGSTKATRKITAENLKRVSEELPGLGEALAADLAAFFESPEAAAEAQRAQATAEAKGQPFDSERFFAEKIGPALQMLEDRANEKAELRIVKSIHRDFETVVKTPEFATWLGTLSKERQTEVRESPDGFVAADAVTEFKEWKTKTAKAAERNKSRLESAITPKGTPAPVSHNVNDEEADFEKGFGSSK